ncbi:MAG TPA: tyrosine-type recombinase/integrase [Polyangiaceae bacterium]|nr:tyrosine-type recombinase/integrase [Polyangiaceae bacterium]
MFKPETSFAAFACGAGAQLRGESASDASSKAAILKRHLLPFFGIMTLPDVARSVANNEYQRAKASQGLTNKTINNQMVVLRALLRLAAAERLLDDVPAIRGLAVVGSAPRCLNLGEAHRLVSLAEQEWRLMILCALSTGLTLSELRALKWEHVSLEDGVLVSPSPSRKCARRQFPLCPALVEEFRRAHNHKSHVFVRSAGDALTHGQCKWPLARAARAAGIVGLSWRHLRHTCCVQLLSAGTPRAIVQRLLGYQSNAALDRFQGHGLLLGEQPIHVLQDGQSHSAFLCQLEFISKNHAALTSIIFGAA